MHIAFDPQTFSLQDYGGVSRYFVETAVRLARLPATQISIVAGAHFNAYLRTAPRELVVGRAVPVVPSAARRVLVRANQLLARSWLERHRADIVHETYYSAARTAPLGTPSVLTVFDMIHEKFPAYAPRTARIVRLKRAAIGRAAHLICISENTRRDLVELYRLDPARTSVVRLGFSQPVAGEEALARPYAEPYLLFVGTRGGYKDFDVLLRAYASSPALQRDFLLACFGDAPFSAGELRRFDELRVPRQRLRHAAGGDEVLAAHYRHAALFIYPSRYEGFGMPPLEAMARDCPVVCTNAASLPEVAGEAARLFEPGDADSLRAAVEAVLDSTEEASGLRAKGRARARQFSWEICARQTRAVYERLLEQRSSPSFRS
ncbi:MAG: glycosyltransferase family 4 protein [Burkholderiales bacterium]